MNNERQKTDDIQIEIKKALFFGFHGVNPEEKEHGQTFIVDITYFIEPKDYYDDISKTIDYGEVVSEAEKYFSSKRYNLIEQLARDMALHLISEFKDMKKISVRVSKSSPPVEATVKSVVATYATTIRHKS
jgi:dihydroneopterin aldolase